MTSVNQNYRQVYRIYRKVYRLLILPAILLLAFYYILVIPVGNGDVWNTIFEPWGAALLLMLINHIYLEHLFTTPRDGLVNSINAAILVLALNRSQEIIGLKFYIILIYLGLVFLSGFVFLLNYNEHRKIASLAKFSSTFGKAKIVFPIIAIFTFISVDADNSNAVLNFELNKLLYIISFYVIFLLLTTKKAIEWFKSFPEALFNLTRTENIGIITANLTPNIVTAEFSSNSKIKINDLIIIGKLLTKGGDFSDDNADKIGLVLDFIGSQSEKDKVTARIFLLNEPQRNLSSTKRGLTKINEECTVIECPGDFISKLNSDRIKFYWKRRKDIVGIVTKDSNINMLKAEIIRHQQLENAQLVSIVNDFPDRPIRYQIIEAETRRESQDDKKDFGFTQLTAYQLGEWRKPRDEQDNEISNAFHQFSEFQWVPNMNTLVFKWNSDVDDQNIDDESVDKTGYYLLGKIPKTNLPIYVHLNDLVSHHTAILGVTGSGKTSLVLKLLDEINGINVFTICIDITGQYKNESTDFERFMNPDTREKWRVEIEKIKQARKRKGLPYSDPQRITAEEADEIENSSIKQICQVISDRIIKLRASKNKVLFELEEISNTKLSIDITQYFIQGLLEYAKKVYEDNIGKEPDDVDNFQCCLVLEEAHTLVPENLGISGNFGESKAVIDKISQIALQGRKYGVGFILISQRTATVKKTVLNQCNTMISFRAYDETSFNFLSSYYGDNYVKEITHLKNDGSSRYIIAAGKAVVADRPVIVEIKKS